MITKDFSQRNGSSAYFGYFCREEGLTLEI